MAINNVYSLGATATNSVSVQTSQYNKAILGSPGTINLHSNLSGLQPVSIDLMPSVAPSPYFRKYEIIESMEDILALSCAWYRMRQERSILQAQGQVHIKSMPEKLLDKVLFENLKQEDKELAQAIRDHYSKKIMMLKLKDIKLTKYREDLNEFIHGDSKKFQESICGLVYRLPEFYFHDKKFEEISLGSNKEIKHVIHPSSFRLTHIGTMKVDRKVVKSVEYWFKNENDNLVNIVLEPQNPLLKIWDRIILEEIHVQGKYHTKKRDDFEYFTVKNYSLV